MKHAMSWGHYQCTPMGLGKPKGAQGCGHSPQHSIVTRECPGFQFLSLTHPTGHLIVFLEPVIRGTHSRPLHICVRDKNYFQWAFGMCRQKLPGALHGSWPTAFPGQAQAKASLMRPSPLISLHHIPLLSCLDFLLFDIIKEKCLVFLPPVSSTHPLTFLTTLKVPASSLRNSAEQTLCLSCSPCIGASLKTCPLEGLQ